MVMDADLRDPTEVVLKMIAKWKEGYDVVSAERASRQGESRFKRATANLFYRVTGRLGDVSTPRNAGDFRLADRRALQRPRDGQRRHSASGRRPFSPIARRLRTDGRGRPTRSCGDRIATARILRFTVARRARTGR
jgi:hypothetical protein